MKHHRLTDTAVWFTIGAVLGLLFIAVLGGCSATEAIANETNEVRHRADASRAAAWFIFERIGEVPAEEIKAKASEIAAAQTAIIEATDVIHTELTKTQNTVSLWTKILYWGVIALVVLGLCFLLWKSGLGTLLQTLVSYVPRKKRRLGDMIVDVMDPDEPEGERELVAALRAQDPQLDLAVRNAKAKKEMQCSSSRTSGTSSKTPSSSASAQSAAQRRSSSASSSDSSDTSSTFDDGDVDD